MGARSENSSFILLFKKVDLLGEWFRIAPLEDLSNALGSVWGFLKRNSIMHQGSNLFITSSGASWKSQSRKIAADVCAFFAAALGMWRLTTRHEIYSRC